MTQSEVQIRIPEQLIATLVEAKIAETIGKSDKIVREVVRSAFSQKVDRYSTSDTIFSGEGLSEEALQEVEAAMSGEAVRDTSAAVPDDRISQGLKRIEDEMKKELR